MGPVAGHRLLLSAALAIVSLAFAAAPAQAATNDPAFKDQWALGKISAETAWATGTGLGITIAVVDTGADLGHPDLAAKLVPGRNFVTPGQPPQDDYGHGTHVAGIAGASTANGVGVAGAAPSAKIMPLKVLDNKGEGSSEDIAAAVDYAVANGAQVVNLSLGAGAVINLIGAGFEGAVNRAWANGVICVVAAGNEGTPISYPAGLKAIVVTATTRDDTLADYADSAGQATWAMAAPGGRGVAEGATQAEAVAGDILSTYIPQAYATEAGTSMAAPFVAGAAAVLRSLGLTPQQTVDKLLATAKDLGAPGRDGVYGSGRLDMAAAVAGLKPVGALTTTTQAPTTTAPKATTTTRRTTSTTTPAGTVATTATTASTAPTATTAAPATTETSVPITEPPAGGDALPLVPSKPLPGDGPTTDDGRPYGLSAVALLALVAAAAGTARARADLASESAWSPRRS
jgi:serine protease